MFTDDDIQHMILQKLHLPRCIIVRDVRNLDAQPEMLAPLMAIHPKAEYLLIAAPLLYCNNTMIIKSLQSIMNMLDIVDEQVKRETGQRPKLVENLSNSLSSLENNCMTVQRCVLQGCDTVSKELEAERVDGGPKEN